MKRFALALMLLGGCARDDGAPSDADQRELDAAAAMLDRAGDNFPATEPAAADRDVARR